MYSVSFFRVEIENTADKGSESFRPAPQDWTSAGLSNILDY
jgi:hypothetical protein